jgi:hypothetical protein
MLGIDVLDLPLTRADAITIPAVSKLRNLLVSTVAKFPLVAMRGEEIVDPQPTFLYRTNDAVSPYTRMVWTIDDAIFYGVSLWITERAGDAGDDGRRQITDAARCPREWWMIEDGKIKARPDGQGDYRVMQADEVILIDFPSEGLLNIGRRTLNGARGIEESWVGRARNPIPMIDLHRTEDAELDDTEAADMVQKWATARTSPNGAIGSTPPGVVPQVYGEVKVELFAEGRNAIRTDVGSFGNVRPAMLDGTSGIDSLTYTTKDGERNAFFEFDLPFWTDAFEARMSQDDVVPRGQRVRFQKYQEYPLPTGPNVED